LAGVDDGEDVGSGDAAALARALDLGGVEVVLGDELAHHRRQHLAATAAVTVAVALRLGRRCLLALLALFGLRGGLRRLLLLGLFGLGLGPGGTSLLLGRSVVLSCLVFGDLLGGLVLLLLPRTLFGLGR